MKTFFRACFGRDAYIYDLCCSNLSSKLRKVEHQKYALNLKDKWVNDNVLQLILDKIIPGENQALRRMLVSLNLDGPPVVVSGGSVIFAVGLAASRSSGVGAVSSSTAP